MEKTSNDLKKYLTKKISELIHVTIECSSDIFMILSVLSEPLFGGVGLNGQAFRRTV